MWTGMADTLRTRLDKYVEPKTLEAFFRRVIARGLDQHTVTNRLDLFVLRNGSLSSSDEEGDESEGASPSDDEPTVESGITDSQKSMDVDRDTVSEEPLGMVASCSSETAQRSHADCSDTGGSMLFRFLHAPIEQRGPVLAPVQDVGERGADRGCELPTAAAEPANEQQVAESAEGAVPAREQDAPALCTQVCALNAGLAELRFNDDEVCTVSDDRTGLCAVRGNVDGGTSGSFQQSASACGVAPRGADGGDGSIASSSFASPSFDNGHHTDTGSRPAAEAAFALVGRADKAVQCDLLNMEWSDQICREAEQRIESLKRQISFYDELLK
ncbi:hypothetical protein V5799_020041 [Amblyomma americanum]|uniref:Uncharacterized protein n=1 Tax=Amblyomma americanum TaxID=6943 RepID=A0AAQ4EV08_AMBAM